MFIASSGPHTHYMLATVHEGLLLACGSGLNWWQATVSRSSSCLGYG